jgi:phosphoglycolate phosphatase
MPASYSAPMIIWDLDGTLVDTGRDILRALNAVLRERELPALAEDRLRHLVGHGAEALIRRALAQYRTSAPHTTLHAMTQRLVDIYAEAPTQQSCLFAGIEAAMDWIDSEGWAQAIATNKPRRLTQLVLKGLSLEGRFERVVCPEDVTHNKPHADHLRAALNGRDRGVMIGDSATDFLAARAAGLPCILVDWGYSDTPVSSFQADAIISDPAFLMSSLARLLRMGEE